MIVAGAVLIDRDPGQTAEVGAVMLTVAPPAILAVAQVPAKSLLLVVRIIVVPPVAVNIAPLAIFNCPPSMMKVPGPSVSDELPVSFIPLQNT